MGMALALNSLLSNSDGIVAGLSHSARACLVVRAIFHPCKHSSCSIGDRTPYLAGLSLNDHLQYM